MLRNICMLKMPPVHHQVFSYILRCDILAQKMHNKPKGGIIGNDTRYIADVVNMSSCDIFMEMRGLSFYTLMVQRNELLLAADLANKLNDTENAQKWQTIAGNMEPAIKSFDNGGIIQETERTWDCDVLLAVLYGSTPNMFLPNAPELFPVTDKNVLNTVSQMQDYWMETYPINQDNGSSGVLFGRYADDRDPGCDANGGDQGHAWTMCSIAFAEFLYRVSMELYDADLNSVWIWTD